jgi:transposase InsO family protein
VAETVNGSYKTELIHQRAPWKTKAAVELAPLEWVRWFNHQRLLEPIGYVLLVEAQAKLLLATCPEVSRKCDCLNQTASTKPGAIQGASVA